MAKIAFIGQPNVGKTTLFNSLTGMRQKVGNWTGVTVEKVEGHYTYNNKEFSLVDLPGIYSLMSNSIDQKIAREFIVENKDATFVNIIDTPNLNRNLYLTLQLIELGVVPIICLNLIDEAEKYGITIDDNKLSKKLGGAPIIRTSGRLNIGHNDLKKAIADYRTKQPIVIEYSEILENAVLEVNKLLDKHNIAELNQYPRRWVSLSILEGDAEIISKLNSEFIHEYEQIKNKIEFEIKHDVESYVTEQRYSKCDEILSDVYKDSEVHDDIDVILVHPVYGLVIFAAVMYLLYTFVFTMNEITAEWAGIIIEYISGWIAAITPAAYQGIVVDGIVGGVGAVLEFFPLVFVMIFSLATLENTGYLSRVAALLHNIMSKFGLSGKSFIPLVTGFGCTLPAVVGTRYISGYKERLTTLLVAPFVPCSARFVIIAFLAAAFFPANQALFSMFVLAVSFLVLIASSWILSKYIIKGENEDFVFELPPYRIPDWKNVISSTWSKSKGFLKKAGTLIAAGSVLFYALTTYPTADASYAYMLGNMLSPLTSLMGLDGTAGISLIFGIIAKELVVSTLEILYTQGIQNALTPLTGLVLTLVSVLYIPCFATVATIYLETRSLKWTAFSVFYNLGIASLVGIIVYQVGRLMGF
ncbi:ferrous iron transport protein B [Methanococcus voltae]|uniref:Ferrous iron transport protein B n=2 Tax=Methanococcus voltae TaxID=2188 RepID=A0A8J7URV5_METVO|nr:ferrous iron transport protein B [Methanococcus voltae]MBP2172047.1 ferrous iron transport protein B [Methanococcus voltae]MBP2200997.1 ferrous iron transport protein B [Methanococcus voltae]MCS3921720.1 ferrous iron transport protein B [Methanococcus voltae PS]